MEHKRPSLVTAENSTHTPLLIIDKKGSMGLSLAKQLQEQFLTVFVSGKEPSFHKNLIHIPFHKKIPVVPDNSYSHIIVFYYGEQEIIDILPSLMQKANAVNGKLLFVTSLPYSNPELLRYLSSPAYHNMQIIIYGELFDKELSERNIVTLFIHQAKLFNRIDIPNDGLGKLYPIFLEDVLEALVATAFTSDKKRRIILLFPKHSMSELTVARLLQKKQPLLRLDFVKYKGSPPTYYLPPEGEYYFSDYPFEKRLREVFDEYIFKEPVKMKKEKKKREFPRQPKMINPGVFWILFLSLLLLPILFTIMASVVGAGAMQLSIKQIEKGNIASGSNFAQFAEGSLTSAETVGESLFYVDFFAKAQKDVFIRQIDVGKRLAETEVDLLHAMNILQAVSENKSKSPKNDFMQGIALLKNSLIIVQKMQAERELPTIIENKLVSLTPVLTPLQNTIDALPNLLGFEGKRTYLVLFQNNMELRPGGGFIGSYGILKIENGVVKDFSVRDVYDADGKLTVHVEPPYGLRRYLGANHWFLRDSNFAIDFPHDAQQAATFLNLETGEKVDGVFGMDTTFLKNVLSALGQVDVPDYKETVTADNFYMRTQMHVENNFFPGSTQKKDFLGSLLTAMETRLADHTNVKYDALLTKIGESLLGKHLFFVSSDAAIQKLFTVNNLSSSLWDGREKGKNTYLDFFGVVDANVGLNKANYYLTRSIDQKSILDATGTLTTTATVVYTNNSKKDSPFGGDYKNYVRFVLPPSAVLQSISIDDTKQDITNAVTDPAIFTANSFVPPKGLEVETGQEEGKQTVGFLLLAPTGSSKKVDITYNVVNAISPGASTFTYDLWVFKQPGTEDDSYSYSLSYPSDYQPIKLDTRLGNVGGKLVYSGTISEDTNLKVEFAKK